MHIVLPCLCLAGHAAPKPVSLLAAARADAAAEEAGVPISRKAMQTAQAAVPVAPKQQEQGTPSTFRRTSCRKRLSHVQQACLASNAPVEQLQHDSSVAAVVAGWHAANPT